ncbi:alpha/beta fold hydrolase [Streptomyces sp. Rer75]|uniref:alpha/beta fold hydrolase n=1 Tax=Streptomyces sp. Rer75 TaxID=2750011 RepID=UPI001C54EC81|nr:alpha/beta hydrolase [Streptomyces sp. Rer75]
MVAFRVNEDRTEMTSDFVHIDRAATGGGEVLPCAPTLLLVHGFLDDATVWDGFVKALDGSVATARLDLPGSGARASAPVDTEKLSLALLADEVASVIDDIEGPVALVGQSMGAQVAELAVAARPERVAGLVLLTPVPLGGTRLPEDAVAPFRALGGNAEGQRAVRNQLSPTLDEEALDTLGRSGLLVPPLVAARYADLWNNGVDAAPEQSAYPGPVLIVRGDSDGFVTEELITGAIAPRFPGTRLATVSGGGHWLHVEYPHALAREVLGFLQNLNADAAASGWRSGFSEHSASTFAEGFAEDIVLEASVLARPIAGRALVASTVAAASTIYESLEFTAEASDATTTYLQWKATAFGGVEISGITILEKNADGDVVRAAIHHRPLGAALRFSATLRDRLVGIVPSDHFYAGDPQPVPGA